MIAVFLYLLLTNSLPIEPSYVIEYPGIAFGWLPSELTPPAEGVISAETGTLSSLPGSHGYDYRIMYWLLEEDLDSADKGLWLRQKLEAVLPPDALPGVVFGSMNWAEGSTAVSHLGMRSIGLTASVNFNLLSGSSVMFCGTAYGIFRDGYAVLIYGMAPRQASPAIKEVMEFIIANAWMLPGS